MPPEDRDKDYWLLQGLQKLCLPELLAIHNQEFETSDNRYRGALTFIFVLLKELFVDSPAQAEVLNCYISN